MKRIVTLIAVVLLTVLAGCAESRQVTLRVLTYNIHHGEGMDGRIDLERIAGIIRRSEADLVALQEVDRGVARSGGIDEAERLGELTGMQAVFEKNIDFGGGEYGNAVLSRRPVEFRENHFLPQSPGGEQRGVLEVHVRVGEQKVIFLATHLDHRADDGERMNSMAVLKELAASHADEPIIVAGDFNAVPESRVLAEAMNFLSNSCEVADSCECSYPADKPAQRIDHVLFRQRSGWRCIACRVLSEPVASDHRPVLAVFEVETKGQ